MIPAFHEPEDDVDAVLEAAGVDPHYTATDRLPEHAQWALAGHMHNLTQDFN